MNQLEYNRELAAFDEKIMLAKLEVAKAEERVRELEYEKARFQMDFISALCRQQSQQVTRESEKSGES